MKFKTRSRLAKLFLGYIISYHKNVTVDISINTVKSVSENSEYYKYWLDGDHNQNINTKPGNNIEY